MFSTVNLFLYTNNKRSILPFQLILQKKKLFPFNWIVIFHLFYFIELNLPRFAEPIPNITVTIGKDALLACVVDNLKSFRVSWIILLSMWKRKKEKRKRAEEECTFIFHYYISRCVKLRMYSMQTTFKTRISGNVCKFSIFHWKCLLKFWIAFRAFLCLWLCMCIFIECALFFYPKD